MEKEVQHKKGTALFFIGGIAIVSGCAVGASMYAGYAHVYLPLQAKVAGLEREIARLSEDIASAAVAREITDAHVQELANRRNVIARSQDDLLTSAVSATAPAVVSIVISKDVALLEVEYVNPFGNDPFFEGFGFRVPTYRQVGTETKQIGAGTGFIIRADGYVVTNRHVVSDPEASYTALLSSGEQKTARVVYRDDAHDLAILKMEGDGYPTVELGDSSTLQLGQTVAAIGNALGEYSNSVSVGIVSGLNRTIQAQERNGRVVTLENVIQTDAAINRGNSGGPLLDLNGRVIGVNVATDRYANSIAFSIPINTVRPIIDRVLQ